MRVRQMVGQQAGQIVELEYAQATALLATGQVIHPWEASPMRGGPQFEPEPLPEHLSTNPTERGEQLAAQGLPDVGAVPGAPPEPAEPSKKGKVAKAVPAEDAPKGGRDQSPVVTRADVIGKDESRSATPTTPASKR